MRILTNLYNMLSYRPPCIQGFFVYRGVYMNTLVIILTLLSFQNPFLSITGNFSNLEIVRAQPTPTTSPQRVWATVTAYSSTPDQTDDTPFITAKGTFVRDGIVAANFLEFGTKVRIPELFGDKIFVVEDRMHRRYSDRVDIWFPDRETAILFGKQQAVIEIVES